MSPWSSPVVLARKKDGTFRFCVDLRAVNGVTKGFAHPLPRIDSTLDSLAGASTFSTLDLASGYWQVSIAPEDREKTAFSTGSGLHQFRVMAMGLKNASGTFQRLMELVLAGMDATTCLVYLDDIVLFNRSEDDHLGTLRDVFQRIREAGLKLKPKKCVLARKEVTFLGHRVSKGGVKPDPRNIEKVLSWKEPTTSDEMCSFLGLCGYYARFIEHYTEVSRPLRMASQTPGKLKWTVEMRVSFDRLKRALSSPPLLALPTFRGTFVLYTDACNTSVGAVLTERVDGDERVIAYDSKVLSKAETRWPTYDKELWAVVHAVRRFRQYTVGAPFLVVTDHRPLANIPKSISVERDGTGRRGRWAVELSSFEFDVQVRAGCAHGNADAMSRQPPGLTPSIVCTTRSEPTGSDATPTSRPLLDGLGQRERPGAANTSLVERGTRVCARAVAQVAGIARAALSVLLRLGPTPAASCGVPDEPHWSGTNRCEGGMPSSDCVEDTGTPDGPETGSESRCEGGSPSTGAAGQPAGQTVRTSGAVSSPGEVLLVAGRGSRTVDRPDVVGDAGDSGSGERSDMHRAQDESQPLVYARRCANHQTLPDISMLGDWSRVLGSGRHQIQVEDNLVGIATASGFRVAVPPPLRNRVMQLAHEPPTSGHMGHRRTTLRVKQSFVWPGMYKDIKEYCRTCILCQRRSKPTPSPRAPMQTELATYPFERVAVDITEMATSVKGNRYALVIMDYFSKYVRVYPMPDQKTETILDGVLDWVYDFGVPEKLHSDQGSQFEAGLFKIMCDRLGIRKTRTTPYRPQSDGMVEKFNGTLKDMISKYIKKDGSDWDVDIKAYSFAYNSSVHHTTGHTPFSLVHGFEPRTPLDAELGPPQRLVPVRSYAEDRLAAMRAARELAKKNAGTAAKYATGMYDRKARQRVYHAGDKVWVRDFRAAAGGKPKLGLRYKGPWVVEGQGSKDGRGVIYRVRDSAGKTKVWHHDHLKPYDGDNGSGGPQQGCARPGQPPELPLSRTDGWPRQVGPLIAVWCARHRPDRGTGLVPPPDTHGPLPPYRTRYGRLSRPPAHYQAGGS